MKSIFFILLFLLNFSVFSQTDVYFFKDKQHNITINNIAQADFKPLKKQILEKYSDDVYWFKIPSINSDSNYIFRIVYERIHTAHAYQNSKQLKKLEHPRFLSYKFSRDYDVYIKVDPKLHAYIPIELITEKNALIKESYELLLNGFYYGFAVVIIIYNLFYFILFRDDAFLYYSLFLSSMVLGIFTMDGMLNFYDINESLNNTIMILNYVFLAYFSSKFANSYLLLDIYYPKLKKYSYVAGFLIIALGLLYLNLKDYYYLLILNILVFTLLLAYWICAVLLFNNNVYVKFLAFAYVIILFSAIDFFVLKFLGISFLNVNGITIKIGAFLEMIILSVAVLYRMKVLKEENEFMRNEIINYSKQLFSLAESQHQNEKNHLDDLSMRERDIFNLIIQSKTNKEIADELNISINTVKFHLKNIYEKLHIKSRKEAYNLAIEVSN